MFIPIKTNDQVCCIKYYITIMFQRSSRSSQAAGVIDPMQVDAPPEENDNNEEEIYEVDIDSFVSMSLTSNYFLALLILLLLFKGPRSIC